MNARFHREAGVTADFSSAYREAGTLGQVYSPKQKEDIMKKKTVLQISEELDRTESKAKRRRLWIEMADAVRGGRFSTQEKKSPHNPYNAVLPR